MSSMSRSRSPSRDRSRSRSPRDRRMRSERSSYRDAPYRRGDREPRRAFRFFVFVYCSSYSLVLQNHNILFMLLLCYFITLTVCANLLNNFSPCHLDDVIRI